MRAPAPDEPRGKLRVAAAGRRLRVALLVTGALLVGIAGTSLYHHRSWIEGLGRSSTPPQLVLIGFDGADWNLIDPLLQAGRMPNLASLLEGAARGRLLTINPTLSPVIWTTIATSVKPERHGIVDFTAVNRETGEAIPVTSNLRRVPALWNLLNEAGISSGFVGWWATFPAEEVRGYMVSDRIAYQLFGVRADEDPRGKTWPPDLYEEVRSLVMEPEAVPDAFVSRFLDDPSVLETDDPEEREMLLQFRTILASSESYRRISARLSEKFAPRVASVYFEGTDTVAHLFMRFRPPRLPGVPEEMVRKFGGIIDRFYEYSDELVGEIVARHGRGANYLICSDHGFRSDRDRPVASDPRIDRGRGADWHRKYGIVILSGPAARAGAEIREATVFDVTPTALALAGAPIPQNLEGRVLTAGINEEFLRAHPLRSRDAPRQPAAEGAEDPDLPVSTAADGQIRERLISLGYLTQASNNAHNNRGILHLGRGEYDQAIAEFRLAMRDNPDFAPGYVNLARAFWHKGDDAAAIENLKRAGEITPDMREVPLLLGNIAMKAGNLEAAEKHFLKALEIEPSDTDTLNCLGLVYDAKGEWDRAAAYFRKATEIDSDYAEGYNNLGNVHKRQGDAVQAESWYKRAIEADPFFMGAYANLALVYQERGEFERAADLYRRALEKDSSNPDLHNNLGSLLFRRGDLQAAEEAFRKSISLDEKFAEGYNSLGVVYGAQGKDEAERAAYEKAIGIRPQYADAVYNLGLWHLRHGDDAAGEKLLRQAAQLQPRHAAAVGALAGVRLKRGDAAEARTLIERALALQPNNARFLTLYGEVLARLGERSAAERALRRSLEIQPGQAEAEERLESLRRP